MFVRRLIVPTILALGWQFAQAVPLVVNAQITGDPRGNAPDGLIVNVTITGDTTSSQTQWVVDINSPMHPNVKLDAFYFNLSGAFSDYAFSNFSPSGWTLEGSGANASGSGSADFVFEADKGVQSADDVTNATNLSFTATYLAGNWSTSLFQNAPVSILANDPALGSGIFGAHLQSLTVNGTTCPTGGCSDSGFAIGSPGSSSVPLPGTLALVGLGLLGAGFLRRLR